MVNTGRPSGACGVCRDRRIKCDETKPACLKCIKSGRACSGYSHGLKLRDQTQKTIIKAKLGRAGSKRQAASQNASRSAGEDQAYGSKSPETPTLASSTGSTPRTTSARPRSVSLPTHGPGGQSSDSGGIAAGTGRDVAQRRGSLSAFTTKHDHPWPYDAAKPREPADDPLQWRTVSMPLAEKARCYFLSSYVVYGPRSSEAGMFTFVPSMLSNNRETKQYFEDLFTAVSIAAFSMRPNASHAATYAQLYYGRGLAELRKVIGDKRLAKSDDALASTILLGFYEGLISESTDIVAYNPHFEGAMALLRIRGDEQFSTQLGTEMFDFVMQILMRQYELSLVITEEDLRKWTGQASRNKGAEPHFTAMWVADLRFKVAKMIASKDSSMERIQVAKKLLGKALKFEALVTQRFKVEEQRKAEQSHDGPAYPNWWAASRALNKHAFRLLLCHVIADIADFLDALEGTNPRGYGMQSSETARGDIATIITIIPYLCEFKGGASRGASSPCGQNDVMSMEGITSLLVIWPLWLAGQSRFATVEQHEYIQGKLSWIGQNMGVKHANGVSQYLKLAAIAQEQSPRIMASSQGPFIEFGGQ